MRAAEGARRQRAGIAFGRRQQGAVRTRKSAYGRRLRGVRVVKVSTSVCAVVSVTTKQQKQRPARLAQRHRR
eukprot:3774623-Lingulodinium_polyedra.AAC.1